MNLKASNSRVVKEVVAMVLKLALKCQPNKLPCKPAGSSDVRSHCADIQRDEVITSDASVIVLVMSQMVFILELLTWWYINDLVQNYLRNVNCYSFIQKMHLMCTK